VKAHIFVATLALLIQRLLCRQLEQIEIDFPAERVIEALSTLRLVTLWLEGQTKRHGVSKGCPDARWVLKALKLTELNPPVPPTGKKTVI